MKRAAFLSWVPLLIASSMQARAQVFVELGVGVGIGGCVADGYTWRAQGRRIDFDQECSASPLGFVAVGYSFKPIAALPGTPRASVQLEHWSSIQPGEAGHDRGVDFLSARLRWEWQP